MVDSLSVFCCPSTLITTIATYRTPKECSLWHFVRSMSDLISSPGTILLTTSSSSSPASPIPAKFLTAVLNESPFVIQVEKWVGGEKDETRLFIPHPGESRRFLEMDKAVVKKKGWEWGWAHIKLRCEHRHTMFVVKMLERVDWRLEHVQKCRCVDRKSAGNVEGEGSEDGGEEPKGVMTDASFQGESQVT